LAETAGALDGIIVVEIGAFVGGALRGAMFG
jgi:hypothetical protein